MRLGLEGSRALVTGAARGIGRAIAEALLGAGAGTVVGIDRDWGEEARGFERRGGTAVGADLARVSGRELGERLLDEHGPFDRIVNNVGITTPESFRELGEPGFDAVIATNLRTPLFLTQRLAEELIAAGERGAVLFTGSLHSRINRRHPHYGASKAAIAALARELAAELAPHRIRVNVISPGWVAVGAAADAGDDYSRALEALIPLGRRGAPADLAPLALALLSDAVAGYVTGADVPVDGGLGLHSFLDDLPG